MTTAHQIHTLLSQLAQPAQSHAGMLFAKPLQQANLDYSPASITRLSHLLSQLAKKDYPLDQLIALPNATPFFLTVAAYIAQYIATTTDESIRWLSYAEAQTEISKKNREYGTDFQLAKNFDSSLVADIGDGMFCQPLMAIRTHLQAQGTIGEFIVEMQQAIFSRSQVSLEQPAAVIAEQYLHKVRTGNLLDTQVGFFRELQTVRFDFSEQSLTQIDRLISQITQPLQQAGTTYHQLIAEPHFQSFCGVVGVYVGATVAKLCATAIRWVDYSHAKILFNQPDLPYSLEYSLVMVTPARYYTPLLVVTNALFALTDSYPSTTHGFLAIVQQEMAAEPHKSFTLPLQFFDYFDTLATDTPKAIDTLPPQWQSLMQQAGNVLANHILQIFDGNTALAQVLAYDDRFTLQHSENFGDIDTHRLDSDAQQTVISLERLYSQLNKNPLAATAQVASYSSQLTLPTLTVACVILEIRYYAEPALALQLMLPYRPAQTVAGFALYPMVYQPLDRHSLPQPTLMALLQTLYQQASQFQSPMHTGNFWEHYYLPELGSYHPTPYQSQQHAQPVEQGDIGLLPLDTQVLDTQVLDTQVGDTVLSSTQVKVTPTANPVVSHPALAEPLAHSVLSHTPERNVPLTDSNVLHQQLPLPATNPKPAPTQFKADLQEQLRQDQLRLKSSLSDSDTGKERKLIVVGMVIGVIIAAVMLLAWLKK